MIKIVTREINIEKLNFEEKIVLFLFYWNVLFSSRLKLNFISRLDDHILRLVDLHAQKIEQPCSVSHKRPMETNAQCFFFFP